MKIYKYFVEHVYIYSLDASIRSALDYTYVSIYVKILNSDFRKSQIIQ